MYNNNYPQYGYNNQPYYQQTPAQYQPTQQTTYNYTPQPKTNKIFVTSLEDALNRFSEANSEVVYLHQDENLLFEIKTDMQGKKTFKVYSLSAYQPVEEKTAPTEDFVTRKEFDELLGRFEELKANAYAPAPAPKPKTTGGNKDA